MAGAKIGLAEPYAAQISGLGGTFGSLGKSGFVPKGYEKMKAGATDQFAPSLFNYEGMETIADFIKTPGELGDPGLFARDERGPLGFSNLADMFSDYQQTTDMTRGTLEEGLKTGFKVDIEPLIAQAMHRLKNETIPEISEGFAGTSGIASSDFGGALAGAGAAMEADIGALEYDAGQAAADNRARLTQAAPALSATMLGTPAAWASGLGETENMLRGQDQMNTEGARMLSAFMNFAGLDENSFLTHMPAENISGWDKFGAFMGGVGNLVGGFTGGGGNDPNAGG